jgi:anti-sigma B factor antagonist
MDITITKNGNENVITIKGRLDTLTAPELQGPLSTSVQQNKKTILNCVELEYVSSAGLRVLLMAEKTSKASKTELVIADISDEIREIFDMTGFSEILTIK